jgi:hypothetical protein
MMTTMPPTLQTFSDTFRATRDLDLSLSSCRSLGSKYTSPTRTLQEPEKDDIKVINCRVPVAHLLGFTCVEAFFLMAFDKVSGLPLKLESTPAKLMSRCPVVKALMEKSHTSRIIFISPQARTGSDP